MKYLIDDTVVFDSSNGTLSLPPPAEHINVLPRPAVLLLEVLMTNPGVIMSRNSLMEAAWLDAGLTLSGHNLNTYIKVIRHSLGELGIEKEFIRTLPRVGLMFAVSVEAEDTKERVSKSQIPENDVPPALTIMPEDESLSAQPDVTPRRWKRSRSVLAVDNKELPRQRKLHRYPLFLILVVTLCLLVQYFWPVTEPLSFTLANDRLAKGPQLAGCQLFTRENPGQLVVRKLNEFIQAPENISQCKQEHYYVFFSALNFENSEKITAVWCRYDLRNNLPEECSTNSREYNP